MPYSILLLMTLATIVAIAFDRDQGESARTESAKEAAYWGAVGRVYGPDSDGVACYAVGTDGRTLSCVALRTLTNEEAGSQ
jgi:hypothetical protein